MARFSCMIVEDSPAERQLVAATLRRLPGLEVVEAVDGVDALRQLPGRKMDLVLTDINLPAMGGLQLVSHLKANPRSREIPVVIIAAEGAAQERDRGLALGARAHLSKPIRPDRLIAVVREVLGF